jgi:hypothetical protein
MSMARRFAAPTDAVCETATAWASGFARSATRVWNGAAFFVLILILIVRIPIAAIASVTGRKTVAIAGLTAASFVGAFEYQSQYARWIGAPTVRTANDGAADFASFNRWKRSVEEALKAAALKEQRDQAKSSAVNEATRPNDVLQREADSPIDLGIYREVARFQANNLSQENESDNPHETGKTAAINEAGAAKEGRLTKQMEESEPFSRSPVIDPVSSGRLEAPPSRRLSRHAWGRGRWHGRHYGWGLMGRAFPFALFVR